MGTITIGDSCEVLNGYAFKSEKYTSSGIRVIRIANVQKGYIEDDSPVFYQTADVDLNKYMLRENDLLVSLTGNVGRTALLTKDMLPAALNQRVACLRLKTNKITRGFLFHLLNSDYFESKCIQSSQGVAQKNLSTEWLKSYDLPLYSLSKQNEITKILDNVRNTIILKEQEIQKYDELIKARFIEMFGDPIRNPYGWYNDCLNNVCTKINDGTHCSPESFDKGDYMYITAKNIKQNGLDLSNVTYVSEKVHKPIYQRCNPEFGDILYIKDGATTGIATINTMKNEFTLLSSVALLKYDRSLINGYYLIHLLNSKEMYSKIRKNMGGAAITRLTIAKIKEIKVIVPPIDLQNQFADFVQQVDKSREEVKKSLEKTQQLYDSLMQEYFG